MGRLVCMALVLASAFPALGGIIASGTITLDGTEPLTSALRVFRDGGPSTWASPKPFPGTLSCSGGTCYYETLTLLPPAPFVEVTYDWLSGADANIFLVAYLDSFSVGSLGTNYLGDPGLSVLEGYPGRTFQVIVPGGSSLVLAFSTVSSTSFGTVSYTVDAVPEPVTYALVGGGLALVVLFRRRALRR